MTFLERPHENEKNRALSYVAKLLEEARNSKKERTEDIKELEEIQKLLSTKKYGLVWEQHAEESEEKMKIPVFVEDESKKIYDNLDSENFNFLLEGDNLHSLHLLEKTHVGKIDFIYIDPPYNTGSEDFNYNDNFVLPDDTFKHSKWLSFMKYRLDLATRLLSKDGIIFISIDENEYANLKILCDEIFGGHNRLLTFHMQVRYSDKTLNEKNDWQPIMEYVLLYAKDKNKWLL